MAGASSVSFSVIVCNARFGTSLQRDLLARVGDDADQHVPDRPFPAARIEAARCPQETTARRIAADIDPDDGWQASQKQPRGMALAAEVSAHEAGHFAAAGYGPAVHNRPARLEIPERIFEEFYATEGEAGQAARTRNPGRFLRLRFGS